MAGINEGDTQLCRIGKLIVLAICRHEGIVAKRMDAVLDSLRMIFDFIIIDLPPVIAVTDALIVSRLTDGMIIVARQEYADKRLIDDTVRQLQLQEANIIGFVVNCSHIENKYYGSKYGKYGRYSKYGYYRNGYYK